MESHGVTRGHKITLSHGQRSSRDARAWQVVRNFAARSRGGWSPVSAALSTGGNAAHIFTTLTLADANPILLAQFIACLLLNGVLLVQALVWD